MPLAGGRLRKFNQLVSARVLVVDREQSRGRQMVFMATRPRMACANTKPVSLVEDINSLNLFGKCQPEDLIFSAHEEREKKKKFIQAQKEREKELKRQLKKQKQDEIAYSDFLKEVEERELRKKNGISYYIPPPKACGRGSLLSGAVNGRIGETMPRGRGRLSPEEKCRLPLFERAQIVQKNLKQFSESSLHNNAVQKLYWTGLGTNKEEEFDRYTADSFTSYTDSSSTSDQYEDAESSPQTSSPQSFNSVPSRSSASPVSAASPGLDPPASINLSPLQPPTRPMHVTSPRPRKPRASRLAAKFSNSVDEQEEEDINKKTPSNKIEQAEEESVDVANQRSGTLFNSLNPSQRVLSNSVLRPEDIYYARASSSNNFTLNMNDFPAL